MNNSRPSSIEMNSWFLYLVTHFRMQNTDHRHAFNVSINPSDAEDGMNIQTQKY